MALNSPIIMEETPTSVTPESLPAPISEDVKSQPIQVATPEKGSKTPESNLYAALEEERKLRKEAEQKAKEAEEQLSANSQDVFSDEGKTLQNKISGLEERLNTLQEGKELDSLKAKFPALKDKWDEFDKFRADYPRHKLDNVAKIFLVENGMAEEVPTRMGLERPVAGPKTPQATGMTSEDVADLRKNNYKKYLELLTSGKLNPNDIK